MKNMCMLVLVMVLLVWSCDDYPIAPAIAPAAKSSASRVSVQWTCGPDSVWSIFNGDYIFHIAGFQVELRHQAAVLFLKTDDQALRITYDDGQCRLQSDFLDAGEVLRAYRGLVERDAIYRYWLTDEAGKYQINRRYISRGEYVPPFEMVWHSNFGDSYNRTKPRPQEVIRFKGGLYYLPFNFSQVALDTLRKMPKDDRPFLDDLFLVEVVEEPEPEKRVVRSSGSSGGSGSSEGGGTTTTPVNTGSGGGGTSGSGSSGGGGGTTSTPVNTEPEDGGQGDSGTDDGPGTWVSCLTGCEAIYEKNGAGEFKCTNGEYRSECSGDIIRNLGETESVGEDRLVEGQQHRQEGDRRCSIPLTPGNYVEWIWYHPQPSFPVPPVPNCSAYKVGELEYATVTPSEHVKGGRDDKSTGCYHSQCGDDGRCPQAEIWESEWYPSGAQIPARCK